MKNLFYWALSLSCFERRNTYNRMSGPNPSNSPSPADLLKQVRSHEVAVAELNNLSSSRAVYQRNGNIFFRTTIEKATAFGQKQLDIAKARLQKLS